jgi:predicted alpha/beta-fold hydrolase
VLFRSLLAVLREFRAEERAPVFLVGFSLGGNVVLKLAGELGESASALLRGVCAVSTPLDLAACAGRMAEPENRLYQRRFVKKMRARLLATGRYSERDFAGLNSVTEIDDHITAPSFGLGSAANYYRTQSALRYVAGIRVPALLIQAKDDTFIPFETFQQEALRSNPLIELLATEYGGHLGFLGRAPNRFWVDRAIMGWILSRNAKKVPPGPS